MKLLNTSILLFTIISCHAQIDDELAPSEPELQRISYVSGLDGIERDYFLYLPRGYYNDSAQKWPVILHLHGNGERGNGKEDLMWVTKHGPLMEAWIQKRDFPFILIVPQLHMLGMDTIKDYITTRDTSTIPKRLLKGVPERTAIGNISSYRDPKPSSLPYPKEGNIRGWYLVENDLIEIVEDIQQNYRGDVNKTYLTGLSYGGFGTWYMASSHPNTFAAIAPVCGWGHPDLMENIVEQSLPIWCFAGEKDLIIQIQHFYPGFRKLNDLGFENYNFTIVPEVGHDVWKPVYQGEEIYSWLIKHSLDD